MNGRGWSRGVGALAVAATLSACATASSPWDGHGPRADGKAARMAPGAVCPVQLENSTPATLDARYEVVGMSFDLGVLPAGQATEFTVQCQAGEVRASGVARNQGFDREPSRFQTMARLDPAEVTRIRLTRADAIP